jgi:hypothetical protein
MRMGKVATEIVSLIRVSANLSSPLPATKLQAVRMGKVATGFVSLIRISAYLASSLPVTKRQAVRLDKTAYGVMSVALKRRGKKWFVHEHQVCLGPVKNASLRHI